jgi:hypothetical protein
LRSLTKPYLVEAFRFMVDPLPIFFIESEFTDFDADGFTIETPEGVLEGLPGDYIIQGPNGALSMLNPEAFEKCHEPVDEEGNLALNGWEP